MVIKIIVIFMALLNGLWMILDGFHVVLTGKYFGPEKPGPWSNILSLIGIDPYKFGVPFIIFGILWLTGIMGLNFHQQWAWILCILISILTLWYIPLGTLFSIIFLILVLAFKKNFV